MELIKIGNTRLKIILTDDDLARYEINTDSFDYSDTGARRAFWALMDDAKRSTGFDAAENSLYVQLYPSKSGGCEIYVTKNAVPVLNAERLSPATLHDGSSSVVRIHPGRCVFGERSPAAFAFSTLDDLLNVCRLLTGSGYSGKSSAFRDEGGNYYLIIYDALSGYGSLPNELTVISEFGKRENAESLLMYIGEHGKTLCENSAVSVLGGL